MTESRKFVAIRKNMDVTALVRFSTDSDSYRYGQAVEGLELQTERVFNQVLTVRSDAVYQKDAGEDAPWYVRLVEADGTFIQEVEVQVSYSSGNQVCISSDNVSESSFFDAGYKALIVGGSQ